MKNLLLLLSLISFAVNAQIQVGNLPAIPSVALGDLLLVGDVSETPTKTRKATLTQIMTMITAGTGLDATASVKGVIRLTGDLGGTASSPTVPGLALKYDTTTALAALALKLDVGSDGRASATSDNFAPLSATRTTAVTSSSPASIQAKTTTSGDMVDGFGAVINYAIQDNAAVSNTIGEMGFIRSGSDNTGTFVVRPRAAGSAIDALKVESNGKATLTDSNSIVSEIASLPSSYPLAQPTILFNFERDKKLSPIIDFTRSTTATFVNSKGLIELASVNQPRFDHNPTTGESLGFLFEESRINNLLYSQQFDNAAWSKTRSSITANVAGIAAPDGTFTVDKLVEDGTAANTHLVSQTFSAAASTTYTYSVFVKRAERTQASIIVGSFANQVAANTITLDLITGAYTATDLTRTKVVAYPNEWYRVSSTVTTIASIVNLTPQVLPMSGGTVTYNGDGVSGLYVWQADFEIGSFPTSPIPTVASAVTRSADAASINGNGFLSWFNSVEGTLAAKVRRLSDTISDTFVDISSNTTTNRIALTAETGASNQSRLRVVDTGSIQALPSSIITLPNVSYTIVGGYKVDNFGVSTNGATVSTDNLGTVPQGMDRLRFFSLGTGTTTYSGHIAKFAYYPRRLLDSEIQAISKNTGVIGNSANKVSPNGTSTVDRIRQIASAAISGTEVITENDDNFVTSCTNADPAVCTLMTGYFFSDPKCWANPIVAGTIAAVTGDTVTTVTVDRTDASTAFTLFCQGLR